MPIKNLLHRYQPAQLYIVLVLSVCYFSVQLVLSHITHALTLLMAAYHMLCNIFALTGCILTIKHSKRSKDCNTMEHNSEKDKIVTNYTEFGSDNAIHIDTLDPNVKKFQEEEQSLAKRERREMKLRNTFGWTRIDVLTMLIVCIILASLSFSLLVEALQTLVHIDHQDTMHLPLTVMLLGFVGLVLNAMTYLMIGGYTMHQGSFLHLTPTGEVVLDRAMTNSADDLTLKPDERQLSKTRNEQIQKIDNEQIINDQHNTATGKIPPTSKRQGSVEMLRDVSSTIFVIVCAIIVYFAEDEEHTAKFIDPILSIFSCVLLVSLSYPYMKESCLILLQTIPGSIDIEIFERTLVTKFPQIISYHDLHIWQLSAHKSVATIHIKFQNPQSYTKIIRDVRNYFHEQGITEVTIQPEFHQAKSAPSLECLVQCNAPECATKVCCKDSRTDLSEVCVSPNGNDRDNMIDHQPLPDVGNNCESKNEQKIYDKHRVRQLRLPAFLKLNKKVKRSQSVNDIDSKHAENGTNSFHIKNNLLKKTGSECHIIQATGVVAHASNDSINNAMIHIVQVVQTIPIVNHNSQQHKIECIDKLDCV